MKKQFWALLLAGFVALNFIACAKKQENNAIPTPICPQGTYSYNGNCVPGGNGGNGGTGTTYQPFSKNGDVSDGSRFRDLVHRTVGYYYRCLYNVSMSYPSNSQVGCNDVQLQLVKVSETQYTVKLRSASYPGSYSNYIAGYNYNGTVAYSQSITNGFAIEVMNYNPYPYVIFEVVVYGSLQNSQVQYEINFERRPIARGIMIKGRDY